MNARHSKNTQGLVVRYLPILVASLTGAILATMSSLKFGWIVLISVVLALSVQIGSIIIRQK